MARVIEILGCANVILGGHLVMGMETTELKLIVVL